MCVPASLTWVGGVRKMGQRLRGPQPCLWGVHSPRGKRFSYMSAVFRDTHRQADEDLLNSFHFLKKICLFSGCTGSSLLTRAFSSWGK